MKLDTKKGGFTLVELLVSISIFFIVTAVVLTNYPRFGSNLAIETLTQDIALTIRQAQVFGSAILGTTADSGLESVSPQVFNAYGVHFPLIPTDVDLNPVSYTYTIFADVPGAAGGSNNRYDGETGIECGSPMAANECLTNYVVSSRRYGVEKFCKNFYRIGFGGSTKQRIEEGCDANHQLKNLDIVFVRPHLEAIFNATNIFGTNEIPSSISNVAIIVSSGDGSLKRAIVVWKTGQISTEKAIITTQQ